MGYSGGSNTERVWYSNGQQLFGLFITFSLYINIFIFIYKTVQAKAVILKKFGFQMVRTIRNQNIKKFGFRMNSVFGIRAPTVLYFKMGPIKASTYGSCFVFLMHNLNAQSCLHNFVNPKPYYISWCAIIGFQQTNVRYFGNSVPKMPTTKGITNQFSFCT